MPTVTGVAWIRQYLPRWLQGAHATDAASAVGRQIDAIQALELGDQLFVQSATWGLAWDFVQPDGTTTPSGWERDYGLPVVVADSLAVRRARILAKMRGNWPRTAQDFADSIQYALVPPQSCPPTIFQTPGMWTIYKLCEAGWPTNFDALTLDLAALGPAHVALWLAPWDACRGLEVGQLDTMAWHAIDVLTVREFDGGYCPPPDCPPELLLDAIDATPLDAVDGVLLDLYEFCTSEGVGWTLATLDPLSLTYRIDQINLEELV